MKLFLLFAIFICTGFYLIDDSNGFENKAQVLEMPAYLNSSSKDTVPEKPADPMQQLFDAVDKMERKLDGMGKQPKDSISDGSHSERKFLDELHRAVIHVEEEITKSFKPKQDTLSQQQNAVENVEVDTLMQRDTL